MAQHEPTAETRAEALPPWTVGHLPEAPGGGWRFWVGLLGPGVVLAGTSIGTGEWLFGPYVSAQYGATLLWLATLSIVFQVFCNLTMIRYTLYCGEPILVGAMRTAPGPWCWVGVYLLIDLLGVIWPYNSANAAVPLATAIRGRLPELNDPLVFWLSLTIFFASFVPLIFGGTIYRMLEKIMTFKLAVILSYLTLVAIFLVSPKVIGEVCAGFFRFGQYPAKAETILVDRHFSLTVHKDDDWVGVEFPSPQPSPKGRGSEDAAADGEGSTESSPHDSADGESGEPSPQPSPKGRGSEVAQPSPKGRGSETMTLRGTFEHGGVFYAEFSIDGRKQDLTKLTPEQQSAVEQLTAKAKALLAKPGSFFFRATADDGAVLTVQGRRDASRHWQPDRIEVTENGQTTVYGDISDVKPPKRQQFIRDLIDGEGARPQNIATHWWRTGKLPDLDWATLAAFAAIAGAGGLANTLFSNYARDKGWGMGRFVGAIPSAIGGMTISLSHAGQVFPLDEPDRRRWRGWLWVGSPGTELEFAL